MEKTFVTWEEIEHWSNRVADKIAEDCPDLSQATLVAVSRGGLIPTQLIAYKLNIRDIRIMKLYSYDENSRPDNIKDVSTDRLFSGANVYFIDDIADSGATVKYIRKKFSLTRICTLLCKDCCQDFPDICARENISSQSWIVFPWE